MRACTALSDERSFSSTSSLPVCALTPSSAAPNIPAPLLPPPALRGLARALSPALPAALPAALPPALGLSGVAGGGGSVISQRSSWRASSA